MEHHNHHRSRRHHSSDSSGRSHHRRHRHSSRYNHSSKETIRFAFFLNLGFSLFEIVAGVFTGSLALLTAAVHDLGDSLSIGYAWWMRKSANYKLASKTSAKQYRFSLALNYLTAFALFIAVMCLLVNAYNRYQLYDFDNFHPEGMFLFSTIGFVINLWAVFRIRKTEDQQEKIVTRHLLEETLLWLAVVAASIVMIFMKIPLLDLILTCIICGFILVNIFRNLKISVDIFLRGNEWIDLEKLENNLALIPDIQEILVLNTWQNEDGKRVLAIQMVIKDVTSIEARQRTRKSIKEICHEFHIGEVIADFRLPPESN